MRIACLASLGILIFTVVGRADDRLVVHEWGTFTSLQDETGRAIGRLNSDDEPVPPFIHGIDNAIVGGRETSKRAPQLMPGATMRLETPVMYFHRPAGMAPVTLSVDVELSGGWLTEYYPDAESVVPALAANGELNPNGYGRLSWPNVVVGVDAKGPDTQDAVWTSPRNVQCDGISVGTESEKFLFYRGIANLESPLQVKRDPHTGVLKIINQYDVDTGISPELVERPIIWLVDIRDDGAVAWRHVEIKAEKDGTIASTPGSFKAADYSTVDSLRTAMAKELVSQGLFPDEAQALLNTWQVSYFKSPGQRLFYLVAPEWTNLHLPLRLSVDADITRVMVGRIELITPHIHDLLRKIKTDLAGRDGKDADDAYNQLGRFRDAILADEQLQKAM